MKFKIAAFTNGDKNIFYQAIVALESVKYHNPDVDLFLGMHEEQLSKKQKEIIAQFNIQLINLSEKNISDYLEKMEPYERYPVEIHARYCIPLYLKQKHYDFAIQVDYDMLCVEQYDFKEILPLNHIFSCMPYRYYESITEKVKKIFNFDFNKIEVPNCGYIVFNIKKYVESDFPNKYIETFHILKIIENCCDYPLEEYVVACCIYKYGYIIKKLNPEYNLLVGFTPKITNAKNFHYMTCPKPWNKFKTLNTFIYKSKSNFAAFILFNKWLNYIQKFPFINLFDRNAPYNENEIVSMLYDSIVLNKSEN